MIGSATRHGITRLFNKFRASTRWGYWIVFSLACAVIIAMAVQSYRTVDRELTDVAMLRRAAVMELAAATLSEKFARLVDVTVSLATRVRFRELVAEGKWVEASAILREVPRDFPFIERLFLADIEGTLMADMPELPGVRGTNFAYREWYKGVSRDWRPYVSPVYQRAAEPRLYVFAVAGPIRNARGEVSGILAMQVRIERFFEWAREIDLGPEEVVYVVDANGQVAFHSKRPAQKEILDFSANPAVQRLRRGENGVEIAFDAHEQENFIFAYAPVAGHGWGMVARQPARASLGLVAKDQQLKRLLIAYGVILLLLVSAMYFASWIAVERRRGEEDRRMNAELEQRVAERTDQLEAANKELESFSYSVSHDLRSPLRAIDGFSRILQEDHNDKLNDESRRLLGVIRNNSQKMGQLIDDLLEFSRLGRKPLATAGIDMNRLVEDVLKEVHAASGPFPKLILGALPTAPGDPALVKQVWANLLANAIKFSSKREQPVIEVTGYENGADNVYGVKDNGAGFDMRYYDKLFGVFQRLHRVEEFDGTGVGLAIVQRVVTRHGGRVWAEGKVGEGAAFYFSLPRGKSDGQF